MSRTSVFILPYDAVSPSAMIDHMQKWFGIKVARIDCVITCRNTQYNFVHFEQPIPEKHYAFLCQGQSDRVTTQGIMRVGLDKSQGLDTTKGDLIIQFITNHSGAFYRNLNLNEIKIWDEESAAWIETAENPFNTSIQEVEMEDDFSCCSTIYATTDDEEPPPLKKQKKNKRYIKTDEELSVCRTLFA
jgi:hypothetical protein